MQAYDLLMLLVLGGLTVYGYFKGMAWQIAYLASFVASYFVAVNFADQFAPVFGAAAPWNKLMAMAAIYLATSFAIWMLFRVVRSAIDSAKLDGFDHQMGAAIGALRGAVWCLGITFIALTFLTRFVPGIQQNIVNSKSGYYIARFIDESESIFPPEVHQVIHPYLEQIDRGLDPNQPQAPPQGLPAFGAKPPSNPTQRATDFLQNLPAQVSGFQQQLRDAGASLNNLANGVQPQPPAAGQPGLPAWPQPPTNQPPAAQPNPVAPRPGTPAIPAGWPAPPAGAGWPGR